VYARWLCFVTAAALVTPARAQDAFEIQVYSSDTAPRGEPGLEVHANHHFVHDAADASHLTFEPHYGVLDWLEVGGYLQTALTDGDVAFGGGKLRVKARLPGRLWHDRVGLAVNTEISVVPEQFEPDVWGSEIRPIADVTTTRFYASINPILAIDLRGELAGHPQLEPAVKLAARASPRWSLGIEAYGAFGPIDDLGSETVGTLLGAVDYVGRWLDLNVGAGPSWGGEDGAIIKLIVGVHPSSD
jgi:hypothetical protein